MERWLRLFADLILPPPSPLISVGTLLTLETSGIENDPSWMEKPLPLLRPKPKRAVTVVLWNAFGILLLFFLLLTSTNLVLSIYRTRVGRLVLQLPDSRC